MLEPLTDAALEKDKEKEWKKKRRARERQMELEKVRTVFQLAGDLTCALQSFCCSSVQPFTLLDQTSAHQLSATFNSLHFARANLSPPTNPHLDFMAPK